MQTTTTPRVPSTRRPVRLEAPSGRRVLAGLHDEWKVLVSRPVVARRVGGWPLPVSVGSLEELMVALGDRRVGRGAGAALDPVVDGEETLLAVLTIARHDDLACRVVLQRLLPGLLSMARAWARRSGEEALDEVISTACIVIRTFPLDRGHRHLAARLLGDCEYRAFRKQARRLIVHEPVPAPLLDGVADQTPSSLHELAELVDAARLSDHDRRLLAMVLSERSSSDVARSLEMSERTVRAHRASMIDRLRSAAVAA